MWGLKYKRQHGRKDQFAEGERRPSSGVVLAQQSSEFGKYLISLTLEPSVEPDSSQCAAVPVQPPQRRGDGGVIWRRHLPPWHPEPFQELRITLKVPLSVSGLAAHVPAKQKEPIRKGEVWSLNNSSSRREESKQVHKGPSEFTPGTWRLLEPSTPQNLVGQSGGDLNKGSVDRRGSSRLLSGPRSIWEQRNRKNIAPAFPRNGVQQLPKLPGFTQNALEHSVTSQQPHG